MGSVCSCLVPVFKGFEQYRMLNLFHDVRFKWIPRRHVYFLSPSAPISLPPFLSLSVSVWTKLIKQYSIIEQRLEQERREYQSEESLGIPRTRCPANKLYFALYAGNHCGIHATRTMELLSPFAICFLIDAFHLTSQGLSIYVKTVFKSYSLQTHTFLL